MSFISGRSVLILKIPCAVIGAEIPVAVVISISFSSACVAAAFR